ncbi:MAG: 4-hydroxy-3-methylbut-2-enyl diphosphate reductase [Treponema sp.]|nr:4-hydroxy-3-methylbut-2-enyl diphosphate reductase [Treponema sp.]
MKVLRASVLGFCFGVRRAVELAQKALAESKSSQNPSLPVKKVYSLGPLIHNETVLSQLAEEGLIIADEENLDKIENNSTVIIRAHGVALKVIKILEEKNCKIIDATCPRVKASQKMVEKYDNENDFVILTGDKNHGEVKAIAGYAGENFLLIQNKEEAQSLEIENADKLNVILLSQTTFSQKEFEEIEKIIKNKFKNIDVMKTICPATKERQEALLELCKDCQGILVIGGKESSNTKRLYLTAREHCSFAAHVQSKEDIPQEFYKLKTIGITAGASTPDNLILEIEEQLKKN